jgi:hypothetical protein
VQRDAEVNDLVLHTMPLRRGHRLVLEQLEQHLVADLQVLQRRSRTIPL